MYTAPADHTFLIAQASLALMALGWVAYELYAKLDELKTERNRLRHEIDERDKYEPEYLERSGHLAGYGEYLLISFDHGKTWRSAIIGDDGLQAVSVADPELVRTVEAMHQHTGRLERKYWLRPGNESADRLLADAGVADEHPWN